jgi:hypothetical protein
MCCASRSPHRQSKLSQSYHCTLLAWFVLYDPFLDGKTPLHDVVITWSPKKLKTDVQTNAYILIPPPSVHDN